MDTKRQLQAAELVKRNFSMVLQQEGSYIYDDALVTVTNVKMSPDLSLAKIYLSVYNTDNKQAVLLKLEDQHHRLKQIFSHRIRKHIRRIPEIAMYIDETLDEMYRLDALFDRLAKSKASGMSEEE
ncbi:MAG: 30S ribosome-binding factor RbfA [Saprospiraceae bacterium]|nr:30S ribosome-binding factor RbfA [Saprospiraceae bacterium]